MSLYDLPSQRRAGGKRGRWLKVALVLAVTAGGAVFVVHEGLPGSDAAADPLVSANSYLVPPPNGIERAACIDLTGSSAASFGSGVLDALATGLGQWAGPATGDERLARPALHLVVRTVSTNSGATEGQALVDRRIPAVPGLKRPPVTSDPDFVDHRRAWDQAAASREAAWRTADGDANALATDIHSLRTPGAGSSAISGCLAAAATSSDAAPERSLMLASDLLENAPPVTADYGHSPVLLVVSCPIGSGGACPGPRAAEWATRLADQNAGPVRPVRADAASDEIEKWVRGS